jgi:hypothetical protein
LYISNLRRIPGHPVKPGDDSRLIQVGATNMKAAPFRIVNPDRYDIATEVLSSAIRVLEAVGFAKEELPELFKQVANRPARSPVWIDPPKRNRRPKIARDKG